MFLICDVFLEKSVKIWWRDESVLITICGASADQTFHEYLMKQIEDQTSSVNFAFFCLFVLFLPGGRPLGALGWWVSIMANMVASINVGQAP